MSNLPNSQSTNLASRTPASGEISEIPVSSEHIQQLDPSSVHTTAPHLVDEATNNVWPQTRERREDVLEKIPSLFRLVDLIQEDGPDGIVEKTVIDQNSLRRLLNTIQPGSCPSTTEIHFQDLDNLFIKPVGIYGERREITGFLRRAGCLDDNSATLIMGQASGEESPNSLSPGLYLALLPTELEGTTRIVYIVHWPEVATWDDQAASPPVRHNRTTFMRYLTKLTNQVVGLVSASQAQDLNWKTNVNVWSTDHKNVENISVRPGFKISVPPNLVPGTSRARIIPGEHNVGLWVVEQESQSRGPNHHSIYPLVITGRDMSLRNANGARTIQHKVDTQHRFEFSLPSGRWIEFIQLIRDKCLVVISEQGRTRMYIEGSATIDNAVNTTYGRAMLSHDGTGGSQCKFALDEATRLLAIVYGKKDDQKLTTYIFDESFTKLEIHTPPISLKGWYGKALAITRICFRPGFGELCLMNTSGNAHIYSLANQQFRKGCLQVGQSTLDTFPNPDPPCLLIIASGETPSRPHKLYAVPWNSLQMGQLKAGISVAELSPSDGHRVISRLGTNTVHLISFSRDSQTITSIILYERQTAVNLFRRTTLERSCNSLLDSHLHVWTRFPVAAPEGMTTLSRDLGSKELTLVSPIPLAKAQLESYFSVLRSKFKLTVPKIGDEHLPSLILSPSVESELNRHLEGNRISKFKMGTYVQEVLCLVPLHLVIVRGNEFTLMNGGAWDSGHDVVSDGDITRMTDMMSLGWYEPLFQSVSKPVRVLSSIGERGVGKTYTLDHFADTSFGVCGDRHSQGIWLSCTLTDKYLLVALDFKGVHLAEQNNEVGALMGLCSAAVSNLVILRDNLTITYYSDKLAMGLFSLTRFMKPEDSRGLFNSMLAIIVKDVSDPITYATVQEFSDDFQKLIEDTAERSSILSLHRGGIQVIPWPVINTTDFYAMFTYLRERLLQRQPTYPSGSVFLHNLKILMTKIKARDWAPLDQSLASYRANKLLESLPNALRRGQGRMGPLMNMQTNEFLHAASDHANFTLWAPPSDSESPENSFEEETLEEQALSLKALIDNYGTDIESRQRMRDADYTKSIQKSIHDLLERRLEFVQQWAMVNTEIFPQDNRHVREFLGRLERAKASMRDATSICASQCNKCELLCLRVSQHKGDHDCETNHICTFDCELFEPDERREPCGLPAGHEERHMCHAALSDPMVPRLPKSQSTVTHTGPNLAPKPHPCAMRAIEQLRTRLDQETRARQILEGRTRDPGGVPYDSVAPHESRQTLLTGLVPAGETASQSLNLHPRPDSL